MSDYTISNACLLCAGPIATVLDLGATPLANELQVLPPGIGAWTPPDMFPLVLMQCQRCSHLQLDTLVDEKRMYQHYLYVSDTGPANRAHFKAYQETLAADVGGKTVLDIGSNDGLFLRYFKDDGWTVLGVDPSDVSNVANDAGIPTLRAFWTEEMGKTVAGLCGRFDLITCNNCFAHTADLHTFVEGVKAALSPTGSFVFEVAYAPDMLENNLFDLVYHEHIHYWTLAAAREFFASHGLCVYDAKLIDTHGGSIRIFVARVPSGTTGRLKEMLLIERDGLRCLVSSFPARVRAMRQGLQRVLTDLHGSTISVLGYPAKASTLSSYCNLDQWITDVFDDNQLKVERYSHEGKQILPTSEIANRKPDYLLILSWNYAEQLMEKHKDFGGKFIIPMPVPRIVR